MRLHLIIRKVHLATSMVMLSFMLIYVFTGIFLINRECFQIPEVERTGYAIPAGKKMDGDPRDYARYLGESLDLKGRVEFRQVRNEDWIFYFSFPGDRYEVRLTPKQDTLHIQRSRQDRSFFTVVQGIHVLRGFRGGWPYTLWAVMYDVAFASMYLFAVTGIIIWFRLRKKYRYGLWYLAAGLAIPGSIILLYLLWK